MCPEHTGAEQVTKSATEVSQKKTYIPPSKESRNYWKKRLKRRYFMDADGNRKEVPGWQVQLQYLGKRRWFKLRETEQLPAADEAVKVYRMLTREGWDAALAEYRPKADKKAELTIGDFCEIYREAVKKIEYPPAYRTSERYIKAIHFLSRTMKIEKLVDLTPEKAKAFIELYREQGRKEKKDADSVSISCNTILRNSASLFSKQMLAQYRELGHSFSNPFEGIKIRRIAIKGYTPLDREIVDAIWTEARNLRHGYTDAEGTEEPKQNPRAKAGTKAPDFRKPNPGAYLLLLCELGLGMRRNEADKCQWDWFSTDAKGKHFIEIQKTKFFTPKSRQSRKLPVEKVLFDTIHGMRQPGSVFVVPGRDPKTYAPDDEPKNIVYRCDHSHRALAYWLRTKFNITDAKPCHLLRKEFGSYVATSFGLFHAQKYLGHSSPLVTDAFYAGLIEHAELNHARLLNTPPSVTPPTPPTAEPSGS